jgi:hypothetical protein
VQVFLKKADSAEFLYDQVWLLSACMSWRETDEVTSHMGRYRHFFFSVLLIFVSTFQITLRQFINIFRSARNVNKTILFRRTIFLTVHKLLSFWC